MNAPRGKLDIAPALRLVHVDNPEWRPQPVVAWEAAATDTDSGKGGHSLLS